MVDENRFLDTFWGHILDSSQDDFRIRMEHFVATTTAKIDFLSSTVNDLKQHNLSKVFITTLQDEINALKAENSELRDKNVIASLALSDLHTKIKEIECEKNSLITALKILQADSENNRKNFIETKITNVHEEKCDDDVMQIKEIRSDQFNDATKQSRKQKRKRKHKLDNGKYRKESIDQNNERNSKKTREKSSEQNNVQDNINILDHRNRNINSSGENQHNQSIVTKRMVLVAGDSIVQHVHGWELSDDEMHVAVKSFSGAKTEDMEDYLKPLIRREPEEIILHVGTNNIKGQESARMVADHIVNLGLQIEENSPKTKVTISGLILRRDSSNLIAKIKHTNALLASFCTQRNWAFISNDNIDFSCLNRRGLHLNHKGSRLLSKNILNNLTNC